MVAAFDFKGVLAQCVAGLRRTGGTPITVNDRFHIGSCTKTMTATLAARLVEAEQLQWSDTLQVLFPKHQIHPQFRNVTVEQLLRHERGVPSSLPGHAQAVWRFMLSAWPGQHRSTRQAVSRRLLTKGPLSPMGQFAYPNAGYMVLGAGLW
jgi:CubicO group peptidase (beta-lactamase class C family)